MTGLRIEHPGVILKEEFLEPLEITHTQLARCADISYLRANELVKGKTGITPDTAMRLAWVLGATPELWINWQTGYDLQESLGN